jgi:hypothetical protein
LGSKVVVDIKNGQDYSGTAFPYDGATYKSIQIKNNTVSINYEGRLGDYPAIEYLPTQKGLHSISVDTTLSYLVYDSWNEFSDFLNYHGLAQIEKHHIARQLPRTEIKERYTRSAKTFFLVNAEDPSVQKKTNTNNQSVLAPIGSMFEMTPLDNPYGAIENLRVQLFFAGTPLPSRQVELFWRGSEVSRFTTDTDENGIATFKLLGEGDYMLNAVHLVEPEKQGVHWVSYWASITFER